MMEDMVCLHNCVQNRLLKVSVTSMCECVRRRFFDPVHYMILLGSKYEQHFSGSKQREHSTDRLSY
jgi:hypothetical protein